MSNPRLRIVLVDADPARRMSIEKDLGYLGYHRVVPLSSLQALIVLLDNAIDVFGLLVVHEETVQAAGAVFNQLLAEYACTRHSLIYKGATLEVYPAGNSQLPRHGFVASGIPDRSILAQVMKQIDGPARQGAGRALSVSGRSV